jgi:hypothetical protein
LTVGIPLHRSEPWIHNVAENIAALPAGTRVLISDVTRDDDALAWLRRRFRRDRRVRFLDESAPPGWRNHWNLLLAHGDTELFSWLSHDDFVTAGYYERLVLALERFPKAAIAWGPIVMLGDVWVPPSGLAGPPIELGVDRPEYEAIALAGSWNLATAVHGVFRRAWARPLPAMRGDRFADQVWVFGLGLSGHLVEVGDAIYVKRHHPDNTHPEWEPLGTVERLDAYLREVRAGSPVRELAPDAEDRLRAALADT